MIVLLILSCFPYLFAPLAYKAGQKTNFNQILDSFVFITIGGLLTLNIIPEVVTHDVINIIYMFLGALAPTFLEKKFKAHSLITHKATIALGAMSLIAHTAIDGEMMSSESIQANYAMLAGIVIHRIPEGLAVWRILQTNFSNLIASIGMVVMALFTVSGYFIGDSYFAQFNQSHTDIIQAFGAGWILHAILHQPHSGCQHNHGFLETEKKEKHKDYSGSGIGILFGIAVLAITLNLHSHHGHDHNHKHHAQHEHHEHHEHHDKQAKQEESNQLLNLALKLAPWLLLTYLTIALRRKFIKPRVNKYANWLLNLEIEPIILTAIFLGWQLALMQLLFINLSNLWLVANNNHIDQIDNTPPISFRQQIKQIISSSYIWVGISLIVANLLFNYQDIKPNAAQQILIMLTLIMSLNFSNLTATILAVALYWVGWDISSIMFLILGSQILRIKTLKKTENKHFYLIMLMLVSSVYIASFCSVKALELNNLYLSWIGLSVICLLYTKEIIKTDIKTIKDKLIA